MRSYRFLAIPAVLACILMPIAAAAGPDHARLDDSKLTPAMQRMLTVERGPYKVWIFFTDKGLGSRAAYDAAIAKVAASYNPRAIERRRLRGDNAARGGALFDERDLPVVSEYVDAVTAAGARVRVTTTWLNAVSAFVTAEQIEPIAALPFVDRIQPVARWAGPDPIDVQKDDETIERGGGDRLPIDYGRSFAQLEQIRVVGLHSEGYTAEGVIVGILDTGFKRSHIAFNQPGHEVDVIAEYDFVDDDGNTAPEPGDPSSQHRHGTLILGCLGSYLPGDLVGGAFDASFILCKTEDTTDEYQAEEDNYVAGLQFIEANGGDMSTSSLGYINWYSQLDLDGETAVTTIAMNTFNDNGAHSCTAAGNNGHDSDPSTSNLIAPADAFRVITCGAVDSGGSMSFFSSDGPTADGRVKPELLARGSSTHTVDPNSDTDFTTASGTSLSTPLVACAVACLIQSHPEWTPDQMRDALFQTADYFVENGSYDPLFVRGYGIVNALGATQDCNDNGVPDPIELANGDATDCNGNGVLDVCDIADGTSEDCNENLMPDECDIAPPGLGMSDEHEAAIGWQEVSGTGTPLNLSDDGETTVTMPFTNVTFPTASVSVDNNGGIGFTSGASLPYSNDSIPSDSAFGGAQTLFALWDDIDADTGNVYYETIGEAPNRTFIVEWKDRPHYPGDGLLDGDEVTFQIQVFETPIDGAFAQFLYQDVDFEEPDYNNGASASTGYQETGSDGDQWSFNEPVITADSILSVVSLGEPFSQDANGNGIPDECEGQPCTGDLDGSGAINVGDLLMVLDAWGDPGGDADLNEDGIVNVLDLLLLLDNWGPCP
jgi:subtilisin family serine protease